MHLGLTPPPPFLGVMEYVNNAISYHVISPIPYVLDKNGWLMVNGFN